MRLHHGNKRGSNPNLDCNIDSPNSKDQFKTKFTIRVTKRIEVTLTLRHQIKNLLIATSNHWLDSQFSMNRKSNGWFLYEIQHCAKMG